MFSVFNFMTIFVMLCFCIFADLSYICGDPYLHCYVLICIVNIVCLTYQCRARIVARIVCKYKYLSVVPRVLVTLNKRINSDVLFKICILSALYKDDKAVNGL